MKIEIYLWVAAGVMTSVILPLLVRSVKDQWKAVPAGRLAHFLSITWPYIRKCLLLLLLSLLTSLLIIAYLGDNIKSITWQSAFLAGYAWDSTIQKFIKS